MCSVCVLKDSPVPILVWRTGVVVLPAPDNLLSENGYVPSLCQVHCLDDHDLEIRIRNGISLQVQQKVTTLDVTAIREIDAEIKLHAIGRLWIRCVHCTEVAYPLSCMLEGPYSISSIALPSGSLIHAWRELSMPILISVTVTPLLLSISQNASSPVTSRQKCL